MSDRLKGTTILAVKGVDGIAMAGDGQVTMGEAVVMKHSAVKVRRLYRDRIVAGFAGTTADAFTLFEKFEAKLEEFSGNLLRASVELTKEWRTDKYLRRLEAMMIVADAENILVISGTGDVIEPDDGVAAIGSGGPYALAAARALSRETDKPPEEVVRTAMDIAGDICVYTNSNIVVETIKGSSKQS